jgi:hypothetical protein
MSSLSQVRPRRRPLAERIGLTIDLNDRLARVLRRDQRPAAPAVNVFANCLEADLSGPTPPSLAARHADVAR